MTTNAATVDKACQTHEEGEWAGGEEDEIDHFELASHCWYVLLRLEMRTRQICFDEAWRCTRRKQVIALYVASMRSLHHKDPMFRVYHVDMLRDFCVKYLKEMVEENNHFDRYYCLVDNSRDGMKSAMELPSLINME